MSTAECTCAACQAAQPQDIPVLPLLPSADDGMAVIELDDGSSLPVPSCQLKAISEVFRTALECGPRRSPDSAHKAPAGKRLKGTALRLPVPGVSNHQAELLVRCLSCWARESWAESLGPADLLDPALLAHKNACTLVLQLVDSTLVKRCTAQRSHGSTGTGACLTPASAPEQLQAAHDLGLGGYEACVGAHIGRHADEVDLAELDCESAHILRGALESRAAFLQSMQHSSTTKPGAGRSSP